MDECCCTPPFSVYWNEFLAGAKSAGDKPAIKCYNANNAAKNSFKTIDLLVFFRHALGSIPSASTLLLSMAALDKVENTPVFTGVFSYALKWNVNVCNIPYTMVIFMLG